MKQLKILFVLLLMGTFSTYACKCTTPESIKDAYQGSEIIINGRVLKTEHVKFESLFAESEVEDIKRTYSDENTQAQFLDMDLIKVEFRVERLYKGDLAEQIITIYTAKSRASCGLPIFKKDQEYIAYLSANNYMSFLFNKSNARKVLPNSYWTNQCTLTQEFDLTVDQKLCDLSG
ncbi:hypothetical protein [Zeaxanthinibacter enoshimensis]|uniref:Tissue inhibitor of metalloproteinase n=1 Tax=Zeaxanthinibacter enoshimensis TaxID=392009 RepID=A0A4R6TEJ0_9FLAO|nr:hypothetical protein [Zeaxanthinibacter enoshimensis]TDQ28153.1 hypothetical protein CLV82_2965 [Zeaxanthinibacter enoshimensis]